MDIWRANRKQATGKVVQRNTAWIQMIVEAYGGIEPPRDRLDGIEDRIAVLEEVVSKLSHI